MDDVEASTATPRLAIVLGAAGRVMIITGLIVLLFVVFQLWGTNFQEARSQSDLRDDFDQRLDEAASLIDFTVVAPTTTLPSATLHAATVPATTSSSMPVVDEAVPPEPPSTTVTLPGGYDPAVLALYLPEDGDALARLEIPAIDVDKVVVRGVAVSDLRKGPGHYSQSALPGNAGNSAIAGHRTTWGSPFNRIDELTPGDEIVVTTIQGEFRYRVLDPEEAYDGQLDLVDDRGDGHIIVDPNAAWVLTDFGDDRLTLTACHPKLSSRQRIVVAAELINPTVELPEWVVEADRAQQVAAVTQLGAHDIPDDTGEQAEPADTGEQADLVDEPAPQPTTTEPPAADLDEGLNGERGAIPGASAWMGGAIGFWFVGGFAGRRWTSGRSGRFGLRLAGLVPAALCLWFAFEMIDRALPAG